MDTTLLKASRRLWTSEFASEELNKANQLKWARAVKMLGEKWLLAHHVQKKVRS
jgi:hypothetical protein